MLSAARRRDLAQWARDVDGYIVEDDYDAEYRYDRHPVGAMQGVAPERVVYAGTLSKSLAPGLRLGWLALPRELVDPVIRARAATDLGTSSLAQATLTAFLASGDLDRHRRRTRWIYRQRRDALVDALARWLPDGTPSGVAAGLHVLVFLPPDFDERRLAAGALAAGVRVYPLSSYRTRPRPDDGPAVVLGYGHLTAAEIQEGVRTLAQVAALAHASGSWQSNPP